MVDEIGVLLFFPLDLWTCKSKWVLQLDYYEFFPKSFIQKLDENIAYVRFIMLWE